MKNQVRSALFVAVTVSVLALEPAAHAQCQFGVLETPDPFTVVGVLTCDGHVSGFDPNQHLWLVSPTNPQPRGHGPLVLSPLEGLDPGAGPSQSWLEGTFEPPPLLAESATTSTIPDENEAPPLPSTPIAETLTSSTSSATAAASELGTCTSTTSTTCPDHATLLPFVDAGTTAVSLEQRDLGYEAPIHGGPPDDFSGNHGDDPVHPGTGELILRRTDLSLSGFGLPFVLGRVYRSAWRFHGALGHAWTHRYEQRLVRSSSTCGDRDLVDWQTGEGDVIRFVSFAHGAWISQSSRNYRLAFVADSSGSYWEITAPDGVRNLFNEDGTLRAIVDLNDNALTFTWAEVSTAGDPVLRLVEAIDTVGRTIAFRYAGDGYLDSIEVVTNGSIIATLGYDVDHNGDLVAARNASGIHETYEYDTDPSRASEPVLIPSSRVDAACQEYCGSCVSPCASADAAGYTKCMFECNDPAACQAAIATQCQAACDDGVTEEHLATCSSLCRTGCTEDPATCDPLRPLDTSSSEYRRCLDDENKPDGSCDWDITDPEDDRLETCCMATRHAYDACIARTCPEVATSCEARAENDCTTFAQTMTGACDREPVGECGDHDACLGFCHTEQICALYDSCDLDFTFVVTVCVEGGCATRQTDEGSSMRSFPSVPISVSGALTYSPDDVFTGEFCLGSDCDESEGGPMVWHADGTWQNLDPDDVVEEFTCDTYWACNVDQCMEHCSNCEANCRDLTAAACIEDTPERCQTHCGPHCESVLSEACVGQCVADMQPQCEYGACRAACRSIDYQGACEESCLESCQAQNQDPVGPRYGNAVDLDHNLRHVRDGAGRLIVSTEYATDLHDPAFDRVVWQSFGGDEISYAIEPTVAEAVDLCLVDCVSGAGAVIEHWVAIEPGSYLVFTDGLHALGLGSIATWPVTLGDEGGFAAVRWLEITRDEGDPSRALVSPPIPGAGSTLFVATPGGELPFLREAGGTFAIGDVPHEALVAAFGEDGKRTLTLARTPRGWRAYPGRAVGGAAISDPTACVDEMTIVPLGLDVATVPKQACVAPVEIEELGRRDVEWRSLLTTPYGRTAWFLHGLSTRAGISWTGAPWNAGSDCAVPPPLLPEPDPMCVGALGAWSGAPKEFAPPGCEDPWFVRGGSMGGLDGEPSLGCPPPGLPPIPSPCEGELGYGEARVRAAGDPVQPIARRTTVLDPRGATWVYYSSANGTVLRVVNENTGARTDLNYRHGRLIGSRSAFGDRSCAIYDVEGNLVEETRLPAGEGADQPRIQRRTLYGADARPLVRYDVNDPSSPVVTYEWDLRGNLGAIRIADDIHGELVEHHVYDPAAPGRLTRVEGPRRTDFIVWDPETGRPSQITTTATAAPPRVRTATFDSFGRTLMVTETGRPTFEFVWARDGRLEAECLALGVGSPSCTSYGYDDAGLLEYVSRPDSETFITRNGRGQVDSRRDRTWTPEVEERTTCLVYDAGLLVQETDPTGRSVRYERDLNGDVFETGRGILPMPAPCAGNVTDGATSGYERFETITRDAARGGVSTAVTSGADSSEERGGAMTAFVRDGYGRVIESTVPDGLITRRAYDARDRVLWVAVYRPGAPAAIGAIAEPDVDDANLLSYTRFAYDLHDRIRERSELWFIDDPSAGRVFLGGTGWATTRYDRDDVAGTTTVTGPDGLVATTTVDGLGRAIAEVAPGGVTTTFTRDTEGLILTQRTSPAPTPSGVAEHRITTTRFGAIARIEDLAGQKTYDADFDSSGRPVTVWTPSEIRWLSYDGFGQLRAIDRDDGGVIRSYELFEYDRAGRRAAIEDSRGNRTEWRYDAAGRARSEIYDDGTTIEHAYVAGTSLPSGAITRRGDDIAFGYDGMGRLLFRQGTRAEAWGSITTTVDYDHGLFGVTAASSSSTVTSGAAPSDGVDLGFVYDSRGLVVKETSSLFSTTPLFHSRDAAGRDLTTTSGSYSLSRVWDGAGRLDRLTYGSRTLVDYEWHGATPIHADLGNGLRESWTYDDRGRRRLSQVRRITTGVTIFGNELYYATDATLARADRWFSNAAGTSADVRPRLSSVFGADPRGRLDEAGANLAIQSTSFAAIPSGSILPEDIDALLATRTRERFTYDEADNLIEQVLGTRTWTAGIGGTDNRLVEWNGLPEQVDADGRTLDSNDGGMKYEYDGLGRLRLVRDTTTAGMPTTEFLYDALDRLVGWDGADGYDYRFQYADGRIFREYVVEPSSVGNIIYVMGLGRAPIATVRAGTTDTYYHQSFGDRLSAATGATGQVTERYEYSAYGVPTIRSATGTLRTISATRNVLLLAGRPFVAPVQMYHLGARWYRPTQGRFASLDPAGYADGPNRYAYARSHPIEMIDPSGLGAERSGFPWDRTDGGNDGGDGGPWGDLLSTAIGPIGDRYDRVAQGYTDRILQLEAFKGSLPETKRDLWSLFKEGSRDIPDMRTYKRFADDLDRARDRAALLQGDLYSKRLIPGFVGKALGSVDFGLDIAGTNESLENALGAYGNGDGWSLGWNSAKSVLGAFEVATDVAGIADWVWAPIADTAGFARPPAWVGRLAAWGPRMNLLGVVIGVGEVGAELWNESSEATRRVHGAGGSTFVAADGTVATEWELRFFERVNKGWTPLPQYLAAP